MSRPLKKSTRIAVGGVFSSLCLVVMLFSSFIPFATYAAPALAGVMLMVVVEENGAIVAFMVYITVAILSLFIVHDYESKFLFISFFGYYPIIKPIIEKKLPKLISYIVKLAIFNAAVISSYSIMIFIFGMSDLMEDFSGFGAYSQLIILIAADIVFLVYDYSLDRYSLFYKYRLRKSIIRQ